MPVDDLTRIGVDRVTPLNLISDVIVGELVHRHKLRETITISLLILFGVSVLATYVLIFLWGWKKIDLPNGFVHWLGAATISQTASLLLIVTKNLFPDPRAS